MDTGKYIRAGIRLIEGKYHAAEYILIRVNDRAEICAVAKQSTDNQADGHSPEQINTKLVVFFLTRKKEIGNRYSHIGKP